MKLTSENVHFDTDLGFMLGVMRLNFGFPVVFDEKEGKVLKSSRFFGPLLEANMSSKILFYVARRAQDPSGEGPGGVFFKHKI